MRFAGRGVPLVMLWLLAWGEISLANVLSGIVVASVLLTVFPLARRSDERAHPSPVGIARLSVYILKQLVLSNLVMARVILGRRPSAPPGVLVHDLTTPSDVVVTVMTSVIALSPGTMTVDVDDHASSIAVHFFALHDAGSARSDLVKLERLVCAAVGTGDPHPNFPERLKESQ